MKWQRIAAIAAMVAGLSIFSAAAAEDVDFRYENTFDNGINDLVEVDNDYYTFTFNGGGRFNSSVTVNGNVGVRSNPQAWGEGQTKFTLKNGGINKGKVRVSFDFSVDTNKAGHSGDNVIFGMNMTSSWEGGRMFYIHSGTTDTPGSINVCSTVGAYPGAATMELDPAKVYNIEVIFDYDSGTVYYYIDGEMLSVKQTNLGQMTNFSMSPSGMIDYFDNLVFEHLNSMDMIPSLDSAETGGAYIRYSDGIDPASLPSKDIIVKNLFTGKEFLCKTEISKSKVLKIAPEENFEEGCEYELKLPAGIKGYSASAAKETTINFNVGEGNYLTALRLSDMTREERPLTDKNPSETNRIILTFPASISAETAAAGVTLKDSDGNDVAFSPSYNGNIAELYIDGTLLGDSEYTLSIPQGESLARAYDIKFETAEGKILITEEKYFIGEQRVETLDEAAVGDTITVKTSLVSTYKDAASALVSGSMWNKIAMTGYDFAVASFDAESGRKAETTLTFTVADNEELMLKTFLWKGLGIINPIHAESTIK